MIDLLFRKSFKLDYKKILQDVGIQKGFEDGVMAWAFGPNWQDLGLKQAIDNWHSLHGAMFPLKGQEDYESLIKKIGSTMIYFDKEPFMKPEHLYELNKLEQAFRKIMMVAFQREGINNVNEMMDCVSWGLNYDKDLLQCHSYWKWSDEFARNTGIMVNSRDPIVKVIRLLARKWKSKRKIVVVRPRSN